MTQFYLSLTLCLNRTLEMAAFESVQILCVSDAKNVPGCLVSSLTHVPLFGDTFLRSVAIASYLESKQLRWCRGENTAVLCRAGKSSLLSKPS